LWFDSAEKVLRLSEPTECVERTASLSERRIVALVRRDFDPGRAEEEGPDGVVCGLLPAKASHAAFPRLWAGRILAASCFLLFAPGAKFTIDVQAVPELGRLAEEGSEADGQDGGD